MAKTFAQLTKAIGNELIAAQESQTAGDLTALVAAARAKVINGDYVFGPDPTDVLKVFKPSKGELIDMGLPGNFLDRCSNNTTVLFMADFARFSSTARKKGKRSPTKASKRKAPAKKK